MNTQRKYDIIFCLLITASATSYAAFLATKLWWMFSIGNLLGGGAIGMRLCEWVIRRAAARGATVEEAKRDTAQLGCLMNLIVLSFLLVVGFHSCVRG